MPVLTVSAARPISAAPVSSADIPDPRERSFFPYFSLLEHEHRLLGAPKIVGGGSVAGGGRTTISDGRSTVGSSPAQHETAQSIRTTGLSRDNSSSTAQHSRRRGPSAVVVGAPMIAMTGYVTRQADFQLRQRDFAGDADRDPRTGQPRGGVCACCVAACNTTLCCGTGPKRSTKWGGGKAASCWETFSGAVVSWFAHCCSHCWHTLSCGICGPCGTPESVTRIGIVESAALSSFPFTRVIDETFGGGPIGFLRRKCRGRAATADQGGVRVVTGHLESASIKKTIERLQRDEGGGPRRASVLSLLSSLQSPRSTAHFGEYHEDDPERVSLLPKTSSTQTNISDRSVVVEPGTRETLLGGGQFRWASKLSACSSVTSANSKTSGTSVRKTNDKRRVLAMAVNGSSPPVRGILKHQGCLFRKLIRRDSYVRRTRQGLGFDSLNKGIKPVKTYLVHPGQVSRMKAQDAEFHFLGDAGNVDGTAVPAALRRKLQRIVSLNVTNKGWQPLQFLRLLSTDNSIHAVDDVEDVDDDIEEGLLIRALVLLRLDQRKLDGFLREASEDDLALPVHTRTKIASEKKRLDVCLRKRRRESFGGKIPTNVLELFGLGWDELGQVHTLNHVFETSQIFDLVKLLAVNNLGVGGAGLVASARLRLVANKHWGVDPERQGMPLVTFCLLPDTVAAWPGAWVRECGLASNAFEKSRTTVDVFQQLRKEKHLLGPGVSGVLQHRGDEFCGGIYLLANCLTWIVLKNSSHFSFSQEEVVSMLEAWKVSGGRLSWMSGGGAEEGQGRWESATGEGEAMANAEEAFEGVTVEALMEEWCARGGSAGDV